MLTEMQRLYVRGLACEYGRLFAPLAAFGRDRSNAASGRSAERRLCSLASAWLGAKLSVCPLSRDVDPPMRSVCWRRLSYGQLNLAIFPTKDLAATNPLAISTVLPSSLFEQILNLANT